MGHVIPGQVTAPVRTFGSVHVSQDDQGKIGQRSAELEAEFLGIPYLGYLVFHETHPGTGMTCLGLASDVEIKGYALELRRLGVGVAVVYQGVTPYLIAEPWACTLPWRFRRSSVSRRKLLKALENEELRSAYVVAVSMNLHNQGMLMLKAAIKRASQ